ncbi:MAG: hypothetical protein LWX23_09390, partial [Spirochaetia bacterium]|nr:hypothetical protein [Spirochaetia bacterium]
IAEKEIVRNTLLTVVYRAAKTGYPYIKRCRIESWILNRDYSLAPGGGELLLFSTEPDFEFNLKYLVKGRMRKAEENFRARNFPEKGLKAAGVRLAPREVLQAEFLGSRGSPGGAGPESSEALSELPPSTGPTGDGLSEDRAGAPKPNNGLPPVLRNKSAPGKTKSGLRGKSATKEKPNVREKPAAQEDPAPKAPTAAGERRGIEAAPLPGGLELKEPSLFGELLNLSAEAQEPAPPVADKPGKKSTPGRSRPGAKPGEEEQPSLGRGLFARLAEKKNAQGPEKDPDDE